MASRSAAAAPSSSWVSDIYEYVGSPDCHSILWLAGSGNKRGIFEVAKMLPITKINPLQPEDILITAARFPSSAYLVDLTCVVTTYSTEIFQSLISRLVVLKTGHFTVPSIGAIVAWPQGPQIVVVSSILPHCSVIPDTGIQWIMRNMDTLPHYFVNMGQVDSCRPVSFAAKLEEESKKINTAGSFLFHQRPTSSNSHEFGMSDADFLSWGFQPWNQEDYDKFDAHRDAMLARAKRLLNGTVFPNMET